MPLAEQELLTLSELLSSPPVFSGVRVTRSIVLCVCFVDRCLSFFFWPLCCLSFDIQILIIPLVSSNSSCFLIVDSSQTLQHACRKKIFLYLAQQGKFNKQMIDSLPLPRLLQDYLLFKEYGITHCDLVLDSFNYLCNQS
jgi:hypothetical protein